MRKLFGILLLAMLLFSATTATAAKGSVLYRGDFETGDFSQWQFHQMLGGTGCGGSCTIDQVGNATGTIISSPVHQGSHALKCVVSSTGGGSSSNNRCEVLASQAQTGGFQGQSWWYGWWTYFPGPSQTWWPNGDDWNDLWQWQDIANCCAFGGGGVAANDGTPGIYTEWPSHKWIIADPLKYNHWYHFVMHIKWSTNPSVGYLQVNVDGVKKVPQTFMQTMGNAANPAMIFSQGFYGARSTNNTVIQDGFCRASTQTEAAHC